MMLPGLQLWLNAIVEQKGELGRAFSRLAANPHIMRGTPEALIPSRLRKPDVWQLNVQHYHCHIRFLIPTWEHFFFYSQHLCCRCSSKITHAVFHLSYLFFPLHSNCVTQSQAKFCSNVSPCNSLQLNLMDKSAILKVMPCHTYSLQAFKYKITVFPFIWIYYWTGSPKIFPKLWCHPNLCNHNNKSTCDKDVQHLTMCCINEQPNFNATKTRKVII